MKSMNKLHYYNYTSKVNCLMVLIIDKLDCFFSLG